MATINLSEEEEKEARSVVQIGMEAKKRLQEYTEKMVCEREKSLKILSEVEIKD